MKHEFFTTGVALALLLYVPVSMSKGLEVDVYGGFAGGYATQKQAGVDDQSDSGLKVYVGTRFLGPIGVEIAYYNFGRYNNATQRLTGAGAVGVLNLDIRGMTLFAKGGVIDWQQEDLPSGTAISGEDVTYGIGINLAVDRHVLFRTELERFTKLGKDSSSGAPGQDMSMLSFGVNFKF